MPKVSHRSDTVPLSPFRKLIPLADAAKAKGRHVYHLNIGQPDIMTHPRAVERFRKLEWDILEYSPSNGIPSYREALTTYYARFGVDVTADQILVTTGGSEAILFFMLACLDPGDEIIVPEPFYANYNGYAHIADIRVVAITSHIEDGFSLPSPEAFARKITPRTKAIMITSPNNPTGACYSPEEFNTLAEIVKKHDLFLCADEVYREFAYAEGEPLQSILQLPGLEEHAIVIDSVSKRYSATGARVGALVCRNEAILAGVDRFAKLRLSPPGLGQMLSECMLENDEAYLAGVKDDYRNRRDTVYRRLQQMPGVFSYEPGGAFYCFARFPIDNSEDFCRWLLADFEYQGATVMLAPGPGFYATPGLGLDECRIAYVLNVDDLEKAMDCLEKALEVYPGRTTAAQQIASSGSARS
ncbi:pyridoxal phosphate-dependent aminotransferase [Neolewinella lacunae]|uniref:Aminotransferase n=1 Tax=Neolewinella lacunae TaxID=1517758 RepID=A0A923TD09_9BACT|nr:pyridoxal phosphate-dependent aminotransferase [Neolewinella lacunae]MBC6994317.1 pyridoxal phosphate-dependent aminotransferase [Neolewinella lacunae]MDN3634924.1 pyridoxal phosphate-dependent aminotransferase [Neolewinella lacunae]